VGAEGGIDACREGGIDAEEEGTTDADGDGGIAGINVCGTAERPCGPAGLRCPPEKGTLGAIGWTLLEEDSSIAGRWPGPPCAGIPGGGNGGLTLGTAENGTCGSTGTPAGIDGRSLSVREF